LLQDLATRIQTALAANPDLALNEATFGIPDLGPILEAATGVAGLAIRAASLVTEDDVLLISGTSSLLGSDSRLVTLNIRDDGGARLRFETAAVDSRPGLSQLVGSLLHGAFTAPTRLAGVKIASFSATIEHGESSGTITLGAADDARIGGLLTLRQPTLTLQAVGLGGPSPVVAVALESIATVAGAAFRAKGQVGGPGPLSVDPIGGPGFTIRTLVEALFGSFQPGLPELPTGPLTFDADFASDSYRLHIPLTGAWMLPLGVASLAVNDVVVTVTDDAAGLSGKIAGRCQLAGQPLAIEARIPGEIELSGRLPSVNLTALVDDLCGPVLSLPGGFPAIILPAADLVIDAGEEAANLTVSTSLVDLGSVVVVVRKVDDQFVGAAAFALPDDWRFSKISPLFSPLDQLQIGVPALAISTFDSDDFTFAGVQGTRLGKGLSRGASVASLLSLRGLGLEFVAKLLGLEKLPLRMNVADSLADSTVSASLGQSIPVLPGVILFDHFALTIDPNPLQIVFGCQATVTIHGENLPKLAADVAISEMSPRVDLQRIEPWRNPFGISGLTVDKLAMSMETEPAPKFGILGIVTVGGDKIIEVAVAFAGEVPSLLEGKLDGTLSVRETVHDLVGLTLPGGLLEMSISDFELRIVADPLGVTIGDVHFEPGLALQGAITFLGLTMFAKLRIDPARGIFAQAALKDKVQIGHVLMISDATGAGPPSATLDTTTDPFLVVTGQANLLDLSDTIEAIAGGDGLRFRLENKIGAVTSKLECSVSSPTVFDAEGSIGFPLRAAIGPIRMTPGGPDLGTIVLATGFDGSIKVSMHALTFHAAVTGAFDFVGQRFTIPTLTLDVAPSSLADFDRLVRALVVERSRDIFAELFQPENVAKWLAAVAGRAIISVENVARALRDQFHEGAASIGGAIRNTLAQGSEAAAEGLKSLGHSAEEIGGILKGLGDDADHVRDALTGAGFSHSEVSHALQNLFLIPHVDAHGDVPGVVLGDAHGDVPGVIHGDAHTDIPAVTHGDAHGDVPGHIHGDAHGDVPGHIHGDAHGDVPGQVHADAHSDFFAGPHVDSHADFRRLGIHGDVHGDSNGPHVDVHGDVPGITHVGTHGDVPGITHVDTHGDVPGHIPVEVHGDVPQVTHVDAHADVPQVTHVDTHADGP
jgi:hypothetical protein